MSKWPTSPTPPRHPTSIGQRPARGGRPTRSLAPQVLQLLLIILFLVGGYHLTMWLWVATAPKEAAVPSLAGLTSEEAGKLLQASGLEPEVVAEKPSETAPANTVLASDPPPTRKVRVGRVVRLTLSTGSKWAKVPDVREMSVDRARALISEAKLVVGKERARYDKKVPISYVMEQAPKPKETVLRGSEVELVVSRGPRPSPEVIGEETPLPQIRSTEISFEVPPGPGLQEVRIVVQDKHGERTVYTGYHQPGETVTRTVSGEGPNITVQIYLSGILAEERSM